MLKSKHPIADDEVCDTMVDGAPYPASTNFAATSEGTLSIRHFLRPVSYQNTLQRVLPSVLPSDLNGDMNGDLS